MSEEDQKEYFISEQQICPVCKGRGKVYSEKWGTVFNHIAWARDAMLEVQPYPSGITTALDKAAAGARAAINEPVRVECGNCSSKGTVLVPVQLTEEMIRDMVADLDNPAEPAPKGRRAGNAR